MPRTTIDKFKHMHYHWLLGWRESTISYDDNLYNQALALMNDPAKLELVQEQCSNRYSSKNRLIGYLTGILYQWVINPIYRFFNINDFAKNEKLLSTIPLISNEELPQERRPSMEEEEEDDDVVVEIDSPEITPKKREDTITSGSVQGTIVRHANSQAHPPSSLSTLASKPRRGEYSQVLLEAAAGFGFSSAELDNLTREIIVAKYRKLAIKYHPDKPGGTTALFAKLHEHLEILNNFLQLSNRPTLDPQVMAQEREAIERLIQKAEEQMADVRRDLSASPDANAGGPSPRNTQVTMDETDRLLELAAQRQRRRKATGTKTKPIDLENRSTAGEQLLIK